MNRRTVLQILPVAAATGRLAESANFCTAAGGSRFENYTFAFFTASEADLTSRLMEIVIPADQNSPGAKEARVAAFADLMLSIGPEESRKKWRAGLEMFSKEASLEAAVAKAAEKEENPTSELGRFFVALKRMTIDGYYTSEVGIHQDLKYQGNEHLSASPRCDHPEHKFKV
jgi:hypothetical protein